MAMAPFRHHANLKPEAAAGRGDGVANCAGSTLISRIETRGNSCRLFISARWIASRRQCARQLAMAMRNFNCPCTGIGNCRWHSPRVTAGMMGFAADGGPPCQ